MILWTVQDARVADLLEAEKTYVTDSGNIIFPESEDTPASHCNYAYKWLAKQMRKRIGEPPVGVTYPIWAWYKRQGQHDGKPDMRTWRSEPDTTAVARLKLDVPDWNVLLSDFDDWHSVLNYWPVFRTKKAYDAYEKMLDDKGIDWLDVSNWNVRSDTLDQIREGLEESWEQALGIQRDLDDFCCLPWELRSIQATFWELKPEYVVSVERFEARY